MPPGAALRALNQEGAGGKVNQQAQQRPVRAAFDFWSRVARQGGLFRGIY